MTATLKNNQSMRRLFSCAYCVLAASRATSQHDRFLEDLKPRKYITIHSKKRAAILCVRMDRRF
ncbi:hypothetical protein F5B21DRAFT_472440 [Xylaria acuta]|nr:hypothetical protein F5B21DRAFT_472440 [Xylaria acuta]